MSVGRDCLTPVLGACMVGAALATLLCAIALNGHGRLYDEMEKCRVGKPSIADCQKVKR